MNTANKLVVVAGATGKLGRLLIQALLTHPNVRVRALVRDPQKPESQSLASDKVELHAFDALNADDAARAAAVAGSFAVVSTLQGGPEISSRPNSPYCVQPKPRGRAASSRRTSRTTCSGWPRV